MKSLNEGGFLSSEIAIWIGKHRKENEKWFSLSEKCNSLGQTILLELNVGNKEFEKLLIVLWFSRSLSHFQAIVLLMERGMLFESQIVLRTLVEVSFSLVALSKNQEIAQDFLKDDKVQQLKSLNTYMNLPKHLRSRSKKQNKKIKKTIEELKCEIEQNNYRELKTEFIAQKADMSEYYNSIYTNLCSTVHSRIRDLESHLLLNEKKEIEQLSWGPDVSGLDSVMLAANELLIRCMKQVLQLFELENFAAEFNICCTEFDKIPKMI